MLKEQDMVEYHPACWTRYGRIFLSLSLVYDFNDRFIPGYLFTNITHEPLHVWGPLPCIVRHLWCQTTFEFLAIQLTRTTGWNTFKSCKTNLTEYTCSQTNWTSQIQWCLVSSMNHLEMQLRIAIVHIVHVDYTNT